jgi:hypothetical protein
MKDEPEAKALSFSSFILHPSATRHLSRDSLEGTKS